LGGLSDASAEPIRDGQQSAQASNTGDLPSPAQGTWRIEMRYLPIGHRGHAHLTLVDPDGKPRQQLHGLAESRNTGEIMTFGPDGSKLVVRSDRRMPEEKTPKIADVAHGSYDEIVRGKWARGLRTANEITKRDFDYKGYDPSYEMGSDGGQIQNSNSVAYTLGRAMGLDLDGAIRDAGMERRFSGWNRHLLDPDYRRYVAPPQFSVGTTP
jgi:hypothetical protein